MAATIDPPGAARLALPALAVANLVLACGPWLVRLAERDAHVGPLGSAFWRLALAFPILLVATWRVREPMPRRPAPLFAIAALAGLFFAGDLSSWHVGILHTRLANATLLGNVTAVLFPLYGFIVARAWPRPRQAVAIAMAAAGVALLIGRSYELSARNGAGDLICIFAGLCYTAYLIAVARIGPRLGPLTVLTAAIAAGIPATLAFAIAGGGMAWPQAWTPLVLLAIGSQVVGQGLIMFAITRAPPLVVGLMLLTQPIVAATIGWVAYGERLGPADAIGAVLIAAAVLLVRERAPLPAAGGAPSSVA